MKKSIVKVIDFEEDLHEEEMVVPELNQKDAKSFVHVQKMIQEFPSWDLGVWDYNVTVPENFGISMSKCAYDRGITFFDTSDVDRALANGVLIIKRARRSYVLENKLRVQTMKLKGSLIKSGGLSSLLHRKPLGIPRMRRLVHILEASLKLLMVLQPHHHVLVQGVHPFEPVEIVPLHSHNAK